MFFRKLTCFVPLFLAITVGLSGPVNAQSAINPAASITAGTGKNHLAPDVETAMKAFPHAHVDAMSRVGLPTFIHGEIHHLNKTGAAIKDSDLLPALQKITPAFRMKTTDLQLESLTTDKLGFTHVKYRQIKNGLPVVGARLSIHVDNAGLVYAVAGNARNGENLLTTGLVAPVDAIAKARGLRRDAKKLNPSKSRLVYVISTRDESMHLSHEVEVSGTAADGTPILELVYVDAMNGEVVDVHSKVYSAKYRIVYDYSDPFNPALAGTEDQPPGGGEAKVNYDYLGNVYDYYESVFGRDSYDGQGSHLVSVVNYEDPYGGGNNAISFWSGGAYFGDGGSINNIPTGNMANALDVTAHEITHGVTASTSQLIYANEPGALNEGMSDIMGASCAAWVRNAPQEGDADMWKFGKDVFAQTAPGNAIRYMDNPTADGISRDFYPDRIVNGDGHYNSGIANLAYKLLVSGGVHPRAGQSTPNGTIPFIYVNGIGRSKAEQIFYRANTVYLGPGSQFIDARQATAQAALDLYGSNEAASVNQAWDAVGVGGPSPGNSNLINISTRAYVGTDANVLIAGFILGGGGSSKPMLVRAVGPGLTQYGVPGVLADPRLDLVSGGTTIASNDDWWDAPGANTTMMVTSNVGAFALENPGKDAAIAPTLGNGAYTAVISGADSGTGVALVEVYDSDANNPNHLVNISSRAYVGTGNNVMIAGFIISGTGNKTLLIRGIGPQLSAYGVPGVLQNPKLQLFSGGTVIGQNDDWSTAINVNGTVLGDQSGAISAATARAGAFALPNGSADSVLLVSLPPGAYTAIMSGVGDTTGVGLIEVYEVN
ncbi:MAG TPA: M4 family metallopeptidase [Rhodocyclaceae bacterium]|nr:M4 family metallopeptidase [Rhodocyclaceae bacterium]